MEYTECKEMYEQSIFLGKLKLGLLLSGLTIMVKDTAVYLTTYGIDGKTAEGFRLAYLDMLNDNRYYWEQFGPELYRPLKDIKLQEGCKADFKLKNESYQDTEWLRAPGWRFFKTYTAQRKNDLLQGITLDQLKAAFHENRNPYKPKAACDQEDGKSYEPIKGLVDQLIGTEKQSTTFWYPVMIYVAYLLQKTNFVTLE